MVHQARTKPTREELLDREQRLRGGKRTEPLDGRTCHLAAGHARDLVHARVGPTLTVDRTHEQLDLAEVLELDSDHQLEHRPGILKALSRVGSGFSEDIWAAWPLGVTRVCGTLRPKMSRELTARGLKLTARTDRERSSSTRRHLRIWGATCSHDAILARLKFCVKPTAEIEPCS
eukprot:1115515-Prymnesium_polylepis.10